MFFQIKIIKKITKKTTQKDILFFKHYEGDILELGPLILKLYHTSAIT